ncbi:hypothetical protein [Endozoicomonas sp.]|uniref:hypothetical protein n=1 Tax=Endozoicomonas sp. TaxID=1892382 RepID=UPI0028854A13|nr:hypothetical protein [Endozoicomonas sp.]
MKNVRFILILLIACTLTINPIPAHALPNTQAQHSSKAPPTTPDKQGTAGFTGILKTAVAWGMVPLSAEIALNVSKELLKKNHPFLSQLLSIHGSNIRRSTSQHLTDNLAARLESFSYKTLSDDHLRKNTDELQTDLLFRSLFTFSMLSMNAQKARKTYFRLQDILDNIAISASLAFNNEDHERAAALIALAAQVMVYIHPEAKASDASDSINTLFNQGIDWSQWPDFRPRVQEYLHTMDPLVQHSALINLRYCDLLNQWRISNVDCSPYENGTITELEGMAVMADSDEQSGLIKSALKGVPAHHIRNTIFMMGVSVPAVFLYFLNKKSNPAIYAIVDHFAKIAGMATTKSTIERFSSNTRRTLENWGAIDTGKGSATSSTGDFANNYFNTLQKNATAILAEQPNFARSNAQRSIEALVVHLSEAYRQALSGDRDTSAILASALVQNYRENVEVKTGDSLIKSILMAYRPLHSPEIILHIEQQLPVLDPDYRTRKEVRQWYDDQIKSWHELSTAPRQAVAAYGNIDWITTATALAQTREAIEGEKQSGPSASTWYQNYFPDKETIATATIHGTALTYSVLIALIHPHTIKHLMTDKAPFWHLASGYLLLSMFDFGLRSLGEPAIVHLQTVIKNWIGSTTGILPQEDKEIQNELADKVNVINRKLSIEAQTSRSYRATLEALLTRYWSLGNHMLMTDPGATRYHQSALIIALAAYSQRYFHPEFNDSNLVMDALAVSRLNPGLLRLRELGLMNEYSLEVLFALKNFDPAFEKPDVQRAYLKILNTWGLELDVQATGKSRDVLDSWASYGDYLLGAVGFSTQAMVKALVHDNEVVSRSLANFFVNIFEYGTTDSLRKKIYAWSRLKMLNVVSFYPKTELIGANFANQELTDSFRRQKFYFGKPELDMRTQLIQIITSITNSYYQAIILLDNARQQDEAGNTELTETEAAEKVQDLVALTMVRLILFAPDLADDDIYIIHTVSILTLPIKNELASMKEAILGKIEAMLADLELNDQVIINDSMEKARLMADNWLTASQAEELDAVTELMTLP